MGINSTEVSYSFGQLGSGYCKDNVEFKPPAGKVIVGIQFLESTELSGLVADTTQGNDAAFIGFATQVDGNGTESDAILNTTLFPEGITIYGRWTSVTLAAATTTGGIICYFGE